MMATILVVDDQPTNRDYLATILGYDGHEVLQATTGAEGLAITSRRHPSLVIADIVMPAMDGYEFVRRLRGDPAIAATPVMFYTANYFEREARGLASACGVRVVLTKPCEPEFILRAVHSALEIPAAPMPALDGEAFTRAHAAVVAAKLSGKVGELETQASRLNALIGIAQQISRLEGQLALLHYFASASLMVIPARCAVVAVPGGKGPASVRFASGGAVTRDGVSDDPELIELFSMPLRQADTVHLSAVGPRGRRLAPDVLTGEESFMGVGIRSSADVYGALCFLRERDAGAFTGQDEQMALSVATMFAVAYENACRLEQILSQNEELERRVAQRTAELQRSNEELEQFAYVASHDLQEPLRMVANFTELLGRRYRGRLDADADEFIAYAVDGATRMKAMVNDILSLSRLNREVPITTFPLDRAVDEAVRRLEAPLAESGGVLTRGRLPSLTANFAQVVQLYQNLIGNAVKFRSAAPLTIDIGSAAVPDGWVFSVRDNGIGIAPEHAERVFQIFQRLHSRTRYPGTGIGLAICSRIAAGLGGRIWVESRRGEGATFCVSVPSERVVEIP